MKLTRTQVRLAFKDVVESDFSPAHRIIFEQLMEDAFKDENIDVERDALEILKQEVIALNKTKIAAIKHVREKTSRDPIVLKAFLNFMNLKSSTSTFGAGLPEAKAFVERVL